jgi:hypothetical protein
MKKLNICAFGFCYLKENKSIAFFSAQKPLETTQTLAYLWNNGESLG